MNLLLFFMMLYLVLLGRLWGVLVLLGFWWLLRTAARQD